MSKDKFSAVWVSHSSMNDFLHCPRAYFLNNLYRDPVTGHKIQLMAPPLALGQVVHQVLESLSVLPVQKRFQTPLVARFEKQWTQVSQEKGGFFDQAVEDRYKQRGIQIMQAVMKNPGPLERLAVKIQQDLPYYWLSQEDNIILCGKIDWLEYLPDEDAVQIIDFKTGKKREENNSLQLPIYLLLVTNVQKRKVAKLSYWYLETDTQLVEQILPDIEDAQQAVLQVAKKIKLARQLNHFKCPKGEGGCVYCKPLEKVLQGEAIKVGESDYKQDLYVIKNVSTEEDDSIIL